MLNRKGCRVVAMGPGLLAAVIVLASAAVSGAEPLTLFVSPQGDDHWSGRIVEPNGSRTDGPLATIGRAQTRSGSCERNRRPPARSRSWSGAGHTS